jgi:hypothetical protein
MGENSWRELYTAAVLEIDPSKIEDRIRATERAIRVRKALRNGTLSQAELTAMEDALSAMSVMSGERPLPNLRKLDLRKAT